MSESTPHPAPQPSLELSDAEIARRVVAGEAELFELLMRRYNQRLYRILYGELGDPDEAEEVLQETWVRAYRHLASFRGEARLSTWLMRIGLHEAWARRQRQRRFVVLDAERDELPEPDLEPSPERRAFSAELRAELERAVAAMPSHFRTVFLMREVEELSTEETAELLELTPENVKVRLHRARAHLRTALEQQLGDASRSLFGFDGRRCDRIVAGVLERLDTR
jgi:RNA polymerase sigma-70 factor (ECF subfamily)